MNNKVKEEVDHIKVPKEKLHQRIELGVDQAELKDKNKKKESSKVDNRISRFRHDCRGGMVTGWFFFGRCS